MAAAALLLILAGSLSAAMPETLNYQGRMRSVSTGAAVADGNYDVIFSLWSAPGGGSMLWSETRTAGTSQVATSNGLFNVVLGAYSPLGSLAFDQPYYLQIAWHNGSSYEDLLPRQPLTAGPYAFHAKNLQLPTSSSVSSGGTYLFNLTNPGSGAGTGALSGAAPSGVGVSGIGLTGVAGSSVSPGGIGVVAQQSGGALALRAIGNNAFDGAGNTTTFQAGHTVNFTGATVIGLPAVGEANTASNLTPGVGVFDSKAGVDLRFKSLSSSSATLNIFPNGALVQLEAQNAQPLWNANAIYGNPVSGASPANGEFLRYTAGLWTPGGVAPADLSPSGAATGQVLTYNGINWAPAAPPGVTAPLSLTLTGAMPFAPIHGVNFGAGPGVFGSNGGNGPGVYGVGNAAAGVGVYAANTAGGTAFLSAGPAQVVGDPGVAGNLLYVSQTASGSYGTNAIYAYNPASASAAVAGYSADTTVPGPSTEPGAGVKGVGPVGVIGFASIPTGIGLAGWVSGTSATAVFGMNEGGGTAISGESGGGQGVVGRGFTGVAGTSMSPGGTGVYAEQGSGSYALRVSGNASFDAPGMTTFNQYVSFTAGTNLGFGVSAPLSLTLNSSVAAPLHVHQQGTASAISVTGAGDTDQTAVIRAVNTNSGGGPTAGYFESTANPTGGTGLRAVGSGRAIQAISGSGTGVEAQGITAVLASGAAVGVSASAAAPNGIGVYAASPVSYAGAVLAINSDTSVPSPSNAAGRGVEGYGPIGVYGRSTLNNGVGLFGSVPNGGTGGAGILGIHNGNGVGISGEGFTGINARANQAGGTALNVDQYLGSTALRVSGNAQFGPAGMTSFDHFVSFTAGTNLSLSVPNPLSLTNLAQVAMAAYSSATAAVEGHSLITGNRGRLGTANYGVVGEDILGWGGVYGSSNQSSGMGIHGINSSNGYAIFGQTGGGTGVHGQGLTGVAGLGDATGVWGTANAAGGVGVRANQGAGAYALRTTGNTRFDGSGNTATFNTYVSFTAGTNLSFTVSAPLALTATSTVPALYVHSPFGAALAVSHSGGGPGSTFYSSTNDAVYAESWGSGTNAVRGRARGGNAFYGVRGDTEAPGGRAGVFGAGASGFPGGVPGMAGVVGSAEAVSTGVGVFGTGGAYGVIARSTALALSASAGSSHAVYARNNAPGLAAVHAENDSTPGIGVFGSAFGNASPGVRGSNNSVGGVGVHGVGSNLGTGVVAEGGSLGLSATAGNGTAVFGRSNYPAGPAAEFINDGAGSPLKVNALSFPSGTGSSGQVLTTDGSSQMSWANAPAPAAPLSLTNTGAASTISSYNTGGGAALTLSGTPALAVWSGVVDMLGNQIVNLADPINPGDAANKNYVDSNFLNYQTGGSMVGDLFVNVPTMPGHAAQKGWVDGNFLNYQTGGSMVGDLNVNVPTMPGHAAQKGWVDGNFLNYQTGGSMVGDLFVNVPTMPGHAATKSYVDLQLGNFVSKTGDGMSGRLTIAAASLNALSASASAFGSTVAGIVGTADNTNFTGFSSIGVLGQASGNGTVISVGVQGQGNNAGVEGIGGGVGVSGYTANLGGSGVRGQASSGLGVIGYGLTGTAGQASAAGGVGVFADQGAGDYGLKVSGNARFDGAGNTTVFSPGHTVDFTGATVLGLPGSSAPLSLTLSSASAAPLFVTNSAGAAISATAGSTAGPAVLAYNTAASGAGTAVIGRSTASTDGVGVLGSTSMTVPPVLTNGVGIYGFSERPGSYAVFGRNSAASGAAYGVWGETTSPSGGAGVRGDAMGASGTNYGVYGTSSSSAGYGVYGTNTNGVAGSFSGLTGVSIVGTAHGLSVTATSAGGRALRVMAPANGWAIEAFASTNNPAIAGDNAGTGSAIRGRNTSTGTTGRLGEQFLGVQGTAGNGSSTGVYGESTFTGLSSPGVWAYNTQTAGVALLVSGNARFDGAGNTTTFNTFVSFTAGTNLGSASVPNPLYLSNTAAVPVIEALNLGLAAAIKGSGTLVGVSGLASAANGTGVWGYASATAGSGAGVFGRSDAGGGAGVWGTDNAAGGTGVFGFSNGGYGVWGQSSAAAFPAVYAQSTGAGPGLAARAGSGIGITVTSDTGYAVYAQSGAGPDTGHFHNLGSGLGLWAASEGSHGIWGRATTNGVGVIGTFTGGLPTVMNGAGMQGYSPASTGYGVVGQASGPGGIGVSATASGASGIAGHFQAVTGVVVRGTAMGISATTVNGWGVRAHSQFGPGMEGSSDNGYGVVGTNSNGNAAVYGYNSAGFGVGVHGISNIGVVGDGGTYAVLARGGAFGVSATANQATGQAYFGRANSTSPTAEFINDGAGPPLKLNSMSFPSADGVTGQVLTTNGAGSLYWSSAGGGVNPPVTWITGTAYPSGVLTATNTGGGHGLIGYATQPGAASGSIDWNTQLPGGVYGYSSTSLSAGVLGRSAATGNAAAVVGMAQSSTGVYGVSFAIGSGGGSAGGSFEGLSTTGVVGRGLTGVAAVAEGPSSTLALEARLNTSAPSAIAIQARAQGGAGGIRAEADTFGGDYGIYSQGDYGIIAEGWAAGVSATSWNAASPALYGRGDLALNADGTVRFSAKPTGASPLTGTAQIYYDQGTNKLRVSENGVGYVDLLGGSVPNPLALTNGIPGPVASFTNNGNGAGLGAGGVFRGVTATAYDAVGFGDVIGGQFTGTSGAGTYDAYGVEGTAAGSPGGKSVGVLGQSVSGSQRIGVYGRSFGSGTGVVAEGADRGLSATGQSYGVVAQAGDGAPIYVVGVSGSATTGLFNAGIGVYGNFTHPSGSGVGVKGEVDETGTQSHNNIAVLGIYGTAVAPSGMTGGIGVAGANERANGIGVFGKTQGTFNNEAKAGFFEALSQFNGGGIITGVGVYADHDSAAGFGMAVGLSLTARSFTNTNNRAYGLLAEANATNVASEAYGLSVTARGPTGGAAGKAIAVQGHANAAVGQTMGGYFTATQSTGGSTGVLAAGWNYGVSATAADTQAGVGGAFAGVTGVAARGTAVAISASTSSAALPAILAQGNSVSTSYGVVTAWNNSAGTAIYGSAFGAGIGVKGDVLSGAAGAVGVLGTMSAANTTGVAGVATANSSYAVFASNPSTIGTGGTAGAALYVSGSVKIASTGVPAADPGNTWWLTGTAQVNCVLCKVRLSTNVGGAIPTINIANTHVTTNSVILITPIGTWPSATVWSYVVPAAGSINITLNPAFNAIVGDGFNYMVINE